MPMHCQGTVLQFSLRETQGSGRSCLQGEFTLLPTHEIAQASLEDAQIIWSPDPVQIGRKECLEEGCPTKCSHEP